MTEPPAPVPEDWEATLDDLAERRAANRAMGGPERLAKHREQGKLDARARIDGLVDPGSFQEVGTLAGSVPADAVVAGAARIDGRPVFVGAEDFTTVAGTIGPASNAKRHRLAELALQDKAPLVMLLEGAGFRQTGEEHSRAPTDLIAQARCSGRVPIVTAVLGPSAGHGALIAPMSDFTVMTEAAAIFTAGPPVVAASTGEEVSKEDLGGPSVAIASGLVHNFAADDADALRQVRTYLSYLPSSAWSYPPSADPAEDAGPRPVPELLEIVPRDGRRPYDVRKVLDVLVDGGRWFEVQEGYGPAVVCALAHLGGHPVAVVANQPKRMAGSIDAAAATKAAHFVDVADAFGLPLLFLADNPGVLPGRSSEQAAILRAGARLFAAQTHARVPKVNVTMRKAYGFGSMVMAMVGFDGQEATFAWPGATLGAMGATAAANAKGGELEALREAELQASYRSAERLGFDELIDPRETRDVLLSTFERSRSRRQAPAEPRLRSAVWP